VVSKLDLQLEGCGFESHPMLDGTGVKAMPGSIPAPNLCSLINGKRRKIQVAKWGAHQKKTELHYNLKFYDFMRFKLCCKNNSNYRFIGRELVISK